MELIFQDLERGPGWVCVGKGGPTYGAPAITRKLAAFAVRTLLNQFAFIGVRWKIGSALQDELQHGLGTKVGQDEDDEAA
jgi:hypothetical protein